HGVSRPAQLTARREPSGFSTTNGTASAVRHQHHERHGVSRPAQLTARRQPSGRKSKPFSTAECRAGISHRRCGAPPSTAANLIDPDVVPAAMGV
ncbi:MAG: hypothetical protein ACKPEY_18295, partial [Planctomycetota bacterium]